MAHLTVELHGQRTTGEIAGRVLIGRRDYNSIAIADGAVSRIHAWIGADAAGHFIVDLASRTGTLINGEPIHSQTLLSDGDRIEIGPATFTYSTQSPAGDIAIPPIPTATPCECDGGILFDCLCGAPLWAPKSRMGGCGTCGNCQQRIAIPESPASPAVLAASLDETVSGHPALNRCTICQWDIDPSEKTVACPDCKTTYHADCWQENKGCASYGCAQVDVLDPSARPVQIAAPDEPFEDFISTPQPQLATPRGDYLLVVCSFIGAAIGVLAFGIPSLLAAVLTSARMSRRDADMSLRPLMLAVATSLCGLIGGVITSYYWWIGGRGAALHWGGLH